MLILTRIFALLGALGTAIHSVATANRRIERQLAHIVDLQEQTMTALEDLQQVDADLAAAVTDLSSSVDRIDTDFTALEQKIADGVDPALVTAEVEKLRATIDAAKTAKANIDSADPAAPTA